MLPMENAPQSKRFFPPGELWRGMTGGSLSLSLDAAARKWFGRHGGFEISVIVSHESDHGDPGVPPRPDDIPKGGGGQAVTPDIAIRVEPARDFILVARIQDRIYIAGALVHAPGADLVLKYLLGKRLVPQLAVFAEGLFPRKDEARNGYFVRVLAGLGIRGRLGESTFFFSVDVGNGKGNLINTKDVRIGGGVRYAPFAW
jgi:hypothetical protein